MGSKVRGMLLGQKEMGASILLNIKFICFLWLELNPTTLATLMVHSHLMLNENLGGILGGTHC
jgi:hypothetical protein